jgi:hypothetical protein
VRAGAPRAVPGELDGRRLAVAFTLYLAAKACELLDAEVFALGGLVSGHTLKHLLASAACFWLAPPTPASG